MAKFPTVLKSSADGSGLDDLFGGARKNLFTTAHPTGGISLKNLGLKKNGIFYDLQKNEIECKDDKWTVTANLTKGKEELTAKYKCSSKCDSSVGLKMGKDFTETVKVKYNFGCCTVNAKVDSNQKAEIAATSKWGDVEIVADTALSANGLGNSLLAAGYAVPGFKGAYVGGIMALPTMKFSLGLFAAPSVPGCQKATVGAEFISGDAPDVLLGGQFVLDKQLTVKTKVATNGLAHISVVQAFKGMKLTTAIEANLLSAAPNLNTFGAQLQFDK